MKRLIPYLVGASALLLLVVVLLASRGKPVRRMDERITLRQRDKIPYGTAAAKSLLPSLFPAADVQVDARYPMSWNGINSYTSNQAVILFADYFNAEEDELERLSQFVSSGNDVLIIARTFSDEAARFFNISFSPYFGSFATANNDSLRVKLEGAPFLTDSFFTYPGRRYEGSIQDIDAAKSVVLGRNGNGYINFVQMNKGKGRFYIHSSPLAFSNYFILHKNNVTYFQQAISVLPKDVKTVLWNEYFLEKMRRPSEKQEKEWLATLFNYPAFKWGFLTALVTLGLYVLLGMRRKQRVIPLHEKPKNDSVDFVKTLGRLYYDGGDHKNLAEKMGAHFLEHIRSTYKIATHTLDEEFVRILHYKSGYPQPEIENIVASIADVTGWPEISEERLADFHKQLELFYQNT